MLNEYDFTNATRGKYSSRYAKGSNVVILEPDLLDVFHNSEEVNKALRALAEIIRAQNK